MPLFSNKGKRLKQTTLKPAYKFLKVIQDRFKTIAFISAQLTVKQLVEKLHIDASKSDRINFYKFIVGVIHEQIAVFMNAKKNN